MDDFMRSVILLLLLDVVRSVILDVQLRFVILVCCIYVDETDAFLVVVLHSEINY